MVRDFAHFSTNSYNGGMTAQGSNITDWLNLPPRTEAISLWESVHDGELQSITSNLLTRTLEIRFTVPYLLSFHSLPDELKFTFLLEGVRSVRALRFSVWPGEFSLPHGLGWSEQQNLINEYRSKWREESQSWATFESAVEADGDAQFTLGEMATGDDGVALRFGVQMSEGEWYNVFFRAERLTLQRSDQQPISLDDLLRWGHEYWEAFASRRDPEGNE
jgi:hypothetical protein